MRDDTSQEIASWGVAEFTCAKCGRKEQPPLPAEPGKACLAAIGWPADKPEPTLCFVPAKQAARDLHVARTAQSMELLAHCAAKGLQYKEMFVFDFGRLTRVQVAGHHFDVSTEAINRPAPQPQVTWPAAVEYVAKLDPDSRDNLHSALHDQQHLAYIASIKVKGKWRWVFTKNRLHSFQLIHLWFSWHWRQKPGSYERFKLHLACGWWRFELVRRFLSDSDPYWRSTKD